MMKNKEYFDQCFTYGNMRKALNKCCRNVRWKDSVAGYELHAAQNTHTMIEKIKKGTYKLSPYQRFTIFEPKKREIVATRISDRQVQMALCEGGLYDDLVEHFIYDNCACQKGRGTDFALKRLKIHMLRFYKCYGRDGWVLKCDIHKFFPSTRHDVAKAALAKRITDPRALAMVNDIVDSFDGDTGIGLGSQISQLTELAVLDDMDHFIKERLQVKHYVRYMDDFVLIHEDKKYLQYCLEEIRKKVEGIGLTLNEKTTMYPLKQGIKFLQWRFILTTTGGVKMKMAHKKQGKQRRRMRKIAMREAAGTLEPGTTERSFISWKANAERGDSFFQVKRMKDYYDKLKEEVLTDGNKSGKTVEDRTRCDSGEDAGGSKRGKPRLRRDDGRHRNSYGG